MTRRHRSVTFAVEGDGIFPNDMLRYDHCYPATTEDAIKMGSGDVPVAILAPKRRILLRCDCPDPRPPTNDRWKSFGWKVLPLTNNEYSRYGGPA